MIRLVFFSRVVCSSRRACFPVSRVLAPGIDRFSGFNQFESANCLRAYSQYASPNPAEKPPEISPEEQARNEAEASRKATNFRRYKKIFSTLLFTSTLIGVGLARRKKRQHTEELFENAVRIPPDENLKGSFTEFYLYGKTQDSPGCVIMANLIKDGTLKAIKEFEVRDGDVFVASFPKTGTTWVQEIVYLLMNKLDVTKAKSSVMETRFPYLEHPFPGLKKALAQESPRLLKTHLPLDLLPEDVPKKGKVIYITRNPKDTVVSYYHFSRMLTFANYTGTFGQFLQKFMKNHVMYSPLFGNIESYRKHDGPNVLMVSYEELSKDPKPVIKRIANFLDVEVNDDQVDFVAQYTSFDEMSRNPFANYSHWDELGLRNKNEASFMRKGKVGDWKNYFNSSQNAEFDEWISRNNSGNLNFEYE